MLGAKAQQIEPQDPHYETYEDARGKKRQRKRAMPTGLTKRDEKVLVSPTFLDNLRYRMLMEARCTASCSKASTLSRQRIQVRSAFLSSTRQVVRF